MRSFNTPAGGKREIVVMPDSEWICVSAPQITSSRHIHLPMRDQARPSLR